jgi:VanZ family protein
VSEVDPRPPTRRTFALFAAGVAAFTMYGSLVPFGFRPRDPAEAAASFRWAMANRVVPQSRSDALANVLLGVPLGFGLLGAFRADRPGVRPAVLTGLALLPGCAALAAAVEYAQLNFPARTCSGSDVLCQGVGAAAGMALWVVAGRRLTAEARRAWNGARVGGRAGRFLAAYLVLLAFVQALPLDLTASPAALYRKVRDRVGFVPFGEFRGRTADEAWERVSALCRVAGLYLPVGLLAAALPGRFWRSGNNVVRVALAAVGLAIGMEAVQLLVHSRTPSATDVVVGAAAAVLGWVLGRVWEKGLGLEVALVLGQAWLVVLVVVGWQPFDFGGQTRAFDWLPGLPREGKGDLLGLEEIVTKLVMAAPLGVLVAAVGRGTGRGRLLGALAVGVAVTALIEAGQAFLPSRFPGLTDVLLGGLGAVVGARLTARVRLAGSPPG